jgi:hypothetical protein
MGVKDYNKVSALAPVTDFRPVSTGHAVVVPFDRYMGAKAPVKNLRPGAVAHDTADAGYDMHAALGPG